MPVNAGIPLGFNPSTKLMDPQQMMSLQQMAQQGQMQRQQMDEKNELRGAMRGASDPATGRLTPAGISNITQINPQLGLQLTEQQERLRLQDIAFSDKKNEVVKNLGVTYVSAYDRFLLQTGGNKEQAATLARAEAINAVDAMEKSGHLRLLGLDSATIAGLKDMPDPESARGIVTSLGGKAERPGVVADKPNRRDFTDASWKEYERTGSQGDLRKHETPKEPRNVQTIETDDGIFERQGDKWVKLPMKPKGAGEKAAATAAAAEQRRNAQENTMRDDFTKASGEFVKVRDAHQRVIESAADPSAAGDLSLIFNYMKVLDPGSTVREGEFATAQNAGGVDQRAVALYNRVVRGERISADQRADFVDRSDRLYKGAVTNQEKIEGDYEGKAKAAGARPDQVITRHRVTQKEKKVLDSPLSPTEQDELKRLRAKHKRP